MATLNIQRAEPFVRGDQSIRVILDGKDIGLLPKNGALTCEVPAGRHRLQADMNGGRGKALTINVDADEHIGLVVSGTKPPFVTAWDMILFLLICAIPGGVGLVNETGNWVRMGLFVLFLAIVAYRARQRRKGFLKLRFEQEAFRAAHG